MNSVRLAIATDFSLAEKLIEALELAEFECEQLSAIELEPFSDEQSLRFNGKSVAQIESNKVQWQEFSHVFFGGKMAQAEILASAVQAGCIVLDLYGISALIQGVPVVVPSVNDEALSNLRERNIVALANPQISQLVLALNAVVDQPVSQIFATSLLPSSYFGDEKTKQLAGQTARLLNGINLDDEAERVAFDTVPANAQAAEKSQPFAKLAELQFAKIFPNWNVELVLHSVQVPVFYGLSQMVTLSSHETLDTENLSQQWESQEWVNFHQQNVITPVKNGENEEENALQISQLLSKGENALQFWSVADEQRFSLAFLAVELLKRVIAY